MRLTGRDRLLAQGDMQAGRIMGEQHVVMLYKQTETTCPTCGFDEFSQSGLRPDCPTCSGKGKTYTTIPYRSFARVSWPNLTDVLIGIVGKVETGDAMLYVSRDEQAQYVAVQGKGYLTVDGERYGVKSISSAGVGGFDECVIWCTRQGQ